MAMKRIAVVTGGNKGIGKEIATQLVESQIFSDVIIACRDKHRGENAVADIQAKVVSQNDDCKTSISCELVTIGDEVSHQRFHDVMAAKYEKIDVLVNNAAIAFKGSDPTPFHEQCKPTLDVNIRGTVDFTERLLPLVRKGDDARIVNVASMSGRLGQLRSSKLQSQFADPQLTKDQLLSLVGQFEADVMDGTHVSKGWGSSNYGLSSKSNTTPNILCV